MRAASGRALTVGADAHPLYRALIDGVLASGAVPADDALLALTGLDAAALTAARDELVAADWVGRDAAGALTALYPFSLVPTPVQVTLDGATRDAMCAIDALGVAPMLDRPTMIASSCVVCGAALALAVAPDGPHVVEPPTLGVVQRRTVGPAHLNRCGAIRFVCSPEHGAAWVAASGDPHDTFLPLDAAFARARAIFADWYRAGRAGG